MADNISYLYEIGFTLDLIEALNRNSDLSIEDIANACHNMKEKGYTDEDILSEYRELFPQYIDAKPKSSISALFPEVERYSDVHEKPPELAPEMISGILRQRHKMFVSAASKAGKSFLMIELAIALAEGTTWLGFKCKQSKVLYLNFEIDRPSFINRVHRIYEAQNLTPSNDNLYMLNLRGHSRPLDQLTNTIIEVATKLQVSAIIFDPLYKILMGDENSAEDMSSLCREFDKIATETGCSVIYVHHHSKGGQSSKNSMDRYSGSGVLARDADALLDMTELDVPEEVKEELGYFSNTSAFRVSCTLREFPQQEPINVFFLYPRHIVTDSLEVAEAKYKDYAKQQTKKAKAEKREAEATCNKVEFDTAFELCKTSNGLASYSTVGEELCLSSKTIKRYVEGKYSDDYQKSVKNGFFQRKELSDELPF